MIPEEIQNILTHAKTFKSPYTRKCPQRPFENFISILALFPWANKIIYAESQVELLYMGYSSMVSILQWHIRKGKIPGLDIDLLHRLVIAGTNLTDFSVEQKKAICSAVGYFPEPLIPVVTITSPHEMRSSTMPMLTEAHHPTNLHQRSPLVVVSRGEDAPSMTNVAQGPHGLRYITPVSIPSYSRTGLSTPVKGSNAGQVHSLAPTLARKHGTLQEQWLMKARKAGIAVSLPVMACEQDH